jgi:hypothetical protein
VPRAKYARLPGPFPASEQIQRSKFRFRNNQRQKLIELLPSKLARLRVPPNHANGLPIKCKTIAEMMVWMTEQAVGSYLTGQAVLTQRPANPINNLVAIRRLRKALEPFVRGAVDDDTAGITSWADLDAKLAVREKEIAKLKIAPTKRRALAMLCQWIEVVVRQFASANGQTLSQQEMLSYIDSTLKFARVEHPDITKHRARLAALVFPKEKLPHFEG